MKLHFKENLIYLRKKNGYSQIGLASEIGITKGVIGSYEEGRAMPAAENLIKLACLFGVTVDAILQKDLSEGVK
jgi:transcriptional regulator with XRE-family HTH domain